MIFGDLVALSAALCWAGTSLLGRAQSRTMSPIFFNTLRYTVAAGFTLLALPWTLGRVDPDGVSPSALGLLLVSVITGMGIGDSAFFESMKRLGVSRAMPIASSYPLLTGLLAVWLLGEPLTGLLMAGMLLVGIGIWLVTGEGRETVGVGLKPGDFATGLLLAALAAIGWAGSAIAVRPALETVDVVLATTIRMPIAAVLLLLFSRARLRREQLPKLSRATIISSLIAGAATMASTTLFIWAVALLGAGRTAAVTSASPLFAAPLAVLLFGERLTLRLALGIAVTVAGLVLIVAS